MSILTTTLGNGLRVVSHALDTVESVSVGVWVAAGARNEAAEINGVSHFLEHMAFKGTERRSARAISEEIEAVGGHLNAQTSREYTAYFAKTLKEDLGLAVDIIADIVQHPVFDSDELERERAVILQEIHLSHDTPEDVVFDTFQEIAYPDQALGRPILGSSEIIGALPRQAVIDYKRGHYRASDMVLAAAGHLDHDRLVAQARDVFGDLKRDADSAHEPAEYTGGESLEARDLEQVQVVIGYDGIPYDDDDFYAASVFSMLFGGGMSSRLFQEIREKRGLVYSIYSFLSCFADGGLFGIYAGTDEREVRDLIPLIADEITKVREAIDDEEVERARAQLKAGTLMSLESTSARAEQLARQLMVFGRLLPIEEIIARIDAVDTRAVKAAARRLTGSKPTVAALGPLGDMKGFEGFGA